MHNSVLNFIESQLTVDDIENKTVLEIGSLNINGSPRKHIEPYQPTEYIGIDITNGKDVDYIMDATLLPIYWTDYFDLVLCCEMLEHAEHWQKVIHNIKTVLKPGGKLIITTRSPGFPEHNIPDYWRFTIEDIQYIFSDMIIQVVQEDPQVYGVFVNAVKPLHTFEESDIYDYRVDAI